MKEVSFKVKQGTIQINTISVLQKTEEVLVFSIDCKQKYPMFVGVNADNRCFLFGAGENTIGVDITNLDEQERTEIDLIGWSEEEDLFTNHCITYDMGRYSLTVSIVRLLEERQDAWVDK